MVKNARVLFLYLAAILWCVLVATAGAQTVNPSDLRGTLPAGTSNLSGTVTMTGTLTVNGTAASPVTITSTSDDGGDQWERWSSARVGLAP